jgi:flagellar biosynthesis chaperone FliJ
MARFDRFEYAPTTREPEREPWLSSVAWLVRPLLAVVVVGVLVFGGYKLLKSASAAADAAASNAQWVQMGQRLDDLQHRLDQLEKERKAVKEPSKPAAPSPVIVAAVQPEVPKHQLVFSRPVTAQSVASSPASPPAKSSPVNNAAPPNNLTSERADAASGQQWQATADRLGNLVGELDSQRDAIERDQARLDELAERFEKNSEPFTLEKSSTEQQVGPVGLRLQGTDLRNQRYTMRLSVEDTTVELKDRALHEAIQFYALGGKLTFELVVSQIGRDVVSGRLVLPQMTATR